jgi:hypothetical protein
MQHDLAVARSIQQSLLPSSMPQVAGYEIAAWNQPADQTGGDYYDWQFLPDGKVVPKLSDSFDCCSVLGLRRRESAWFWCNRQRETVRS